MMALHSFFFSGSRSVLKLDDVHPHHGFLVSSYINGGSREEDPQEYLMHPGKKRRLTGDQLQFLERSFESANKLEPDRKVQIARDLHLQPRQVAIWFQNRRARWKTKQLEKDYEVLLASYNALQSRYDDLITHKEKLQAEVDVLKNKLLSGSNIMSETIFKNEIISSGKSDMFHSNTPHDTDGARSLIERGGSSYLCDREKSDRSPDEDDKLDAPHVYPKLEDILYCVPPTFFEDPSFCPWSF